MQRSEDDAARDREIIRRELRAYVVELLVESGVEDKNPWHWGMDLLRCIVKWVRRANTLVERFWQTIFIASLVTLGGWAATGFKFWIGGGQ